MGSLTAQNLGTSLLGLVFQVALFRLISPVQYGVFSGIVVAIGIATVCASFGLNQTVTRFLAMLQQDEAKSWTAARKILHLTLVFAIVTAAIYSMLAPDLSLYFTKTTDWTAVFLLSGVWLILSPVSSFSQGIIQGLRKYTLLAKMLFISKVVMVTFALVALYSYHSVSMAIVAWIVYEVIIIAWTFALTESDFRRHQGQFDYTIVLRYSYPLGIASIITIIASSADVVVVGGYLNPVSLGAYNAAVIISGILTAIFVGPLTTALLPELSTSKEDKDISNGLRLALRFIILAVLPASFLVAAVPEQLIDLFSGGGTYLAASSSLELIAFFYLFVAIQTILIVLFQAIGKTINAMIVGVVSATCDIGVSVLLVPKIGLLGAASAKVSVALVGTVVGFYFARKYLGMLDKNIFYLKGITATLIPFAVTFALSSYVSIRVISLIPYSMIFGFIYLACIKSLRLLNDEDKIIISHLLPKFMQRFVNYI